MYLGIQYRIGYEAKLFRTGLTDVIAVVLRPDNVLDGPFALSEIVQAGFAGVYSYNYVSTNTYPEGKYLAIVVSPSESVRDILPFELIQRPLYQVATNLVATIDKPYGVSAIINPSPELDQVIQVTQNLSAQEELSVELGTQVQPTPEIDIGET